MGGGGGLGVGAGGVGGGAVGAMSVEDEEDYENEPPLLEELGINFEHILSKTLAVILPTKKIDINYLVSLFEETWSQMSDDWLDGYGTRRVGC